MLESRNVWMVKTAALVVGLAIVTALLSAAVQIWLTGKTNGAVSGGAAGGVAVVAWLSMKKRQEQESREKQQPKV